MNKPKHNNSRAAANMTDAELDALIAEQSANLPPNWGLCEKKQGRGEKRQRDHKLERLRRAARKASTVEGR